MPIHASQTDKLLHEADQAYHAGFFDRTEEICRQILKSDKNSVRAMLRLGIALARLQRFDDARIHLNRALKISPTSIPLLNNLAHTYLDEGDADEAQRIFERALRLAPGDPSLSAGLGAVHLALGRYEQALESLGNAIQSPEPRPADVVLYADACRRLGRLDEALEILSRYAADDTLPAAQAASILHALGHTLDQLGRYDEAWDAHARGNTARTALFDPDKFSRAISAMIDAWSPQAIASLPRAAARSDALVFIVGMPRSGTSLVEQIIASHPDAAAGGERLDIGRICKRLDPDSPGRGVVDIVSDPARLTKQNVERSAYEYMSTFSRAARRARRLTDKLPENCFNLGLISALFPKCRIIHCARDPLDTSLSCLFQNFAGRVQYQADPRHIATAYGAYRRAMDHWRAVLDLQILDVAYEDLVADQEAQTRRLIEFLDLEWHDDCLQFHKTRRTNITHSRDQVTRPIYTSSVKRSQNYAAHLGPLRTALEEIAGIEA